MIINNTNFKYIKYLLLSLLILLSFYRSPFIFLNGRFLAEEASSHFIYALQNNFFQNLIFFDEAAGYYNFIPNFFTWISTYLKIEQAPLATVYGSFLIIILLPYLCLFRNSILLDTQSKKILASLLLFFSPPFVPEIWLNTINSQVYLCLILVLILFMIDLSRKQKIINNFLVLVSGLSGIYSCSLAPFFLIKYFSEKNSYNLLNLLILIITNIIQLILIIRSKINDTLVETSLGFELNADLFLNLFYNFIAKSIMARQLTHFIWSNIGFLFNNNYFLFLIILFLLTLSLFLFNFKRVISFLKKDKLLLNLCGIFIVISLVVIIGSLGNQVSGRYAVIPGAVLLIIYLHLYSVVKNLYLKLIFFIFISLSLVTGLYEFRPPTTNVKHQYLKYLDCISCPVWSEEIQKWKIDKDYRIGLWPYPKKSIAPGNLIID